MMDPLLEFLLFCPSYLNIGFAVRERGTIKIKKKKDELGKVSIHQRGFKKLTMHSGVQSLKTCSDKCLVFVIKIQARHLWVIIACQWCD